LTDRIADSEFVFEPPREASAIEMRLDQPKGNEGAPAQPAPLSSPKSK
jgi:hypothetical protein